MLDNFTHETIGAAAAAVKAAYPHTLVEASGVREIMSYPLMQWPYVFLIGLNKVIKLFKLITDVL